ncbi:SWIM zinc finger family protein [Streptomyces sp. NPDC046860]|uniref:SWIM zinc finger family protein n=1 Tax=Streptomyces sp. NPDC046860 TaxID=3154495 RepID=UPI0033D23946
MTQQGVRRTAEQVLALAPDAASRKAGSKLGVAGPWSGAGSGEEGVVWGLCKGSGSKPYQTVVDLSDPAGPAYKCSCPSRKFPCKHALGLLLLQASDESAVPAADAAPDWAEQWLAGRRGRAEARKTQAAGGPAADPEAARRRAERRDQRVTAGATELERRLADLLRDGLASAERAGYGMWEETAARMVDAQAPGLAARVRELGAIPASGAGWPARLLEECALLHLLDQGWLHHDGLPDALAATVRTRLGLPAPADGTPVRDRWQVLAQYDSSDARLTTRRIWLHGTDTGRTRLLLSYGAAGRAPELSLPVGMSLDADLSDHPGAARVRATLGTRHAQAAPATSRPPGVTVTRALSSYGEALREDPWLDSVPVTLEAVVPVPDDGSGTWHLADADADTALPLTPAFLTRPGLWRLVALSGGAPLTVFGECGHRGFTPLTAWTEVGGDPVSLS